MSGAVPPRVGTPRDSAEACCDRAAANLLEAVTMMTANQRLRLETSAASWTARADMLQRVEDGLERRTHASSGEPGPDGTDPATVARHAPGGNCSEISR